MTEAHTGSEAGQAAPGNPGEASTASASAGVVGAAPAGAGAANTASASAGVASPAPAGTASADAAAVGSGSEPDARFTFANERTFLAWSRTALALIVAGLGIVQLLPPFPHVPWGRHLIGVPLIVLGATVAIAGYTEWMMNQRALRRGDPIPRSVVPMILTVTITSIGILAAIVLLLSAIG